MNGTPAPAVFCVLMPVNPKELGNTGLIGSPESKLVRTYDARNSLSMVGEKVWLQAAVRDFEVTVSFSPKPGRFEPPKESARTCGLSSIKVETHTASFWPNRWSTFA